jgi:hypothetical protein
MGAAAIPYMIGASTAVAVVGTVQSSRAQRQAAQVNAAAADRQAAVDEANAREAVRAAREKAERDAPVADKNAEIARRNAATQLGNAGFADENAGIAVANAERVRLQGLAESVQQQRVAYLKQSAAVAGYGKAGVRMEGSALDVLEMGAAQAELDRQNIEYNANIGRETFLNQARGFNNQATGFRNAAETELNIAQGFDRDAADARAAVANGDAAALSYANRALGGRETASLNRSAASSAETTGYLTAAAAALNGAVRYYSYRPQPGTGTPIPTDADSMSLPT